MRYRCYAKINLTLEIVGKRPDGFHELSSLVHTISLADELCVKPADALLTRVEGLDIAAEANIVTRAAARLAGALQERRGAELRLVKRIPAAAGLGGGSTDAAATLVGLCSVWRTRLAPEALGRLAVEVGSDVPFFLKGGAALMRGRGDVLEALPPRSGQWLVLVIPRHTLADKTRLLYAALEPGDLSAGDITRHAAERFAHGELVDDDLLVNGFERAARQVFPGLDDLWRAAERLTGRRWSLSGAGPALFALADTRVEANVLAERARRLEAAVYVVRTVKHARASMPRAAIEYA